MTTIVLVIVLAVASALILPSFIDWTQFRSQIEAQASRVVGRAVTIRGDIGLRLLPSPELLLGDIAVADPKDAEAPLLSAERLEAVAAWGPLLQGLVEIRRLHMVEPIVRLRIDEAGGTNWDLAPSAPSGSGFGASGAPFLTDFFALDKVAFSDITVERGLVFHEDVRSGAKDQIDSITGRLALQRLTGPGEGDIRFRLGGAAMRAGFMVGAMSETAPSPVSLKLTLEDGPADIVIDGRAGGLSAARRALSLAPLTFDGTLKAEAAAAGGLADGLVALATFGHPMSRPPALLPAGAAKLSAKADATLVATPDAWTLDGLTFAMGQTRWTGRLVRGRTKPALDAGFATDLIYLDELAASGGGDARVSAVPALTVSGLAAPIRLLAACACEGALSIAAEKLLQDGVTLDGLAIQVGFKPDGATVKRAAIALPGDTFLAVSGALKSGADAGLLLDGRIAAQSGDARLLLSWLKADLGAIEPSRLRTFALDGGLKLIDRAGASASGLRTGDGRAVVVPELADADLTLDGAAYKVSLAANPVPPTALRLTFAGDAFDASAYGLLGTLWPAAPLDAAAWGETSLGRAGRFDALDLDIRLGALGLGKHDAKEFALTISRSADGIAVAGLRIADVAGYAVDFDGARQRSAASELPLSKARLKITGGTQKGVVLPFAEQPLSREIVLDAAYDETPEAARLTLEGVAGGMDLKGSAQGVPHGQLIADFDRLELSAALKEGRAILGGKLTGLSGLAAFEGNLTVDALSFPAYVRALGYDYEPRKGDLGALSLVAELGISADAVRVPRFSASVGDQTATGQGTLALGGERALLDAALDLGDVSLNGFLPKPDGGLLWSTDKIDLSLLERADGQIRLGAERFEVYAFDLKGVSADLTLKDGVLSGQSMTASLYGGALSLTGSVGSRDGTASLAGKGALSNFDLVKAAEATVPTLGITGRADLSFEAAAQGTSQFTLAQSLSGEGTLKAGAGRLQGLDLATWSAGLGKIQTPEGFFRLAKDTLSAGASPFNGFGGRITANAGTLRAEDIALDFDKANAALTGTIALPTKSESLRLRLDLKERTDLPPASVVYTGPVANPQRTYDLANLQKVMLARFEASGAGRISVEDLPPDLQELLKTPPKENAP